MSDNINNCHDDDETVNRPLPINETRLKEMKAMEAAEQRLIEDLFSTHVKANANKIQVNQKEPKKQVKTLNKHGKLKN